MYLSSNGASFLPDPDHLAFRELAAGVFDDLVEEVVGRGVEPLETNAGLPRVVDHQVLFERS